MEENNLNSWCGDDCISTCNRTKVDTYPTPYSNINPKCVRDPNIRAKTIKTLEENIIVNLHDLGFGNGVLDMTPKAQTTKKR